MKRYLLIVAMFLYCLAPISKSLAAGACEDAITNPTSECDQAMYEASIDGVKVTTCIQELKVKYEEHDCEWPEKCPGFGSESRKLKTQCLALVAQVLGGLENAYLPGGDTSPRKYLRELKEVLSKEE